MAANSKEGFYFYCSLCGVLWHLRNEIFHQNVNIPVESSVTFLYNYLSMLSDDSTVVSDGKLKGKNPVVKEGVPKTSYQQVLSKPRFQVLNN